MSSDFRLKADLPEDPDKRGEVIADAFKIALLHAQSDPEMRLRMILGEAYSRMNAVIDWLSGELAKESVKLHDMAAKFDRQPELLTRKIGESDVASAQQKLLALALRRDGAGE